MINENLTKEDLLRAEIEERAVESILDLINQILDENENIVTDSDYFTISLSIMTNLLGNILITALMRDAIIEKDITPLLEQVKSYTHKIIEQHKKQMKHNN